MACVFSDKQVLTSRVLEGTCSLRFQASWLSCNLSSLMDSRKVMFLNLLVVSVGAMFFPTFPILSRKLLLEIVLPLYFTPPRVLS